jgi:endogenous inhibitor of DNA gyrase (YacG/DUF329 family)
MITIKCYECGKLCQKYPYKIRDCKHVFCSKKCQLKNLEKIVKERVRNGTFNLKPKSGKDNPFYGKKHTEKSKEINRIKHQGRKQTKEVIEKRIRRGERCNFWKGGITPINFKIRNSLEYRIWRKAVFERDNYTCVWCGARSEKGKKVILNVDHIKPFSLFPELRFSIDNGRTLCKSCHEKTETYKNKLLDRDKSGRFRRRNGKDS